MPLPNRWRWFLVFQPLLQGNRWCWVLKYPNLGYRITLAYRVTLGALDKGTPSGMKPDQWAAPSWMGSPQTLHKEKGSLLGGGGGMQVHPRLYSLARAGHRLHLSPPCLPCPGCPAFPGRMVLLSCEKAETESTPRAKWSFFWLKKQQQKKTTLSYVNGKWAGIHCSCLGLLRPHCDGAQEFPWDSPPWHGMSLCFG